MSGPTVIRLLPRTLGTDRIAAPCASRQRPRRAPSRRRAAGAARTPVPARRTGSGNAGARKIWMTDGDGDGRERNEHGLQRKAAEQRRVRSADRLQHREVTLTFERREVHHGADDDARRRSTAAPAPDRSTRSRRRAGRSTSAATSSAVITLAPGGIASTSPSTSTALITSVVRNIEVLGVGQRHERQRDAGEQRRVLRLADDGEGHARQLVTSSPTSRPSCLVDDQLAAPDAARPSTIGGASQTVRFVTEEDDLVARSPSSSRLERDTTTADFVSAPRPRRAPASGPPTAP